MKILRTRENGRPHSRAKEKLRSLTLRYLFLCLSRSLSLAASSSLSPPAFCLRVSRPLSFAALRHRQLRSCTPTELHGRHGWAQGLIPPPLSVRRGAGGGEVCTVPPSRGCSQTFRAETRFLAGNLPPSPPPSSSSSSSLSSSSSRLCRLRNASRPFSSVQFLLALSFVVPLETQTQGLSRPCLSRLSSLVVPCDDPKNAFSR